MENIMLDGDRAVLTDFGGAVYANRPRTKRELQSREYRAPEMLLGDPEWDDRIDVWSLGCIVFEVATRKVLFPPVWIEKRDKDLRHFALMTELMGSFPRDFLERTARGKVYFDENGLMGGEPERLPLRKLLREDFEIENEPLAEFIEACLILDPRKRPHASELKKLAFVVQSVPAAEKDL